MTGASLYRVQYITLVLVGAEGTVGYIIRGSAMETIGALQENIAAGISSEIRAKLTRLIISFR